MRSRRLAEQSDERGAPVIWAPTTRPSGGDIPHVDRSPGSAGRQLDHPRTLATSGHLATSRHKPRSCVDACNPALRKLKLSQQGRRLRVDPFRAPSARPRIHECRIVEKGRCRRAERQVCHPGIGYRSWNDTPMRREHPATAGGRPANRHAQLTDARCAHERDVSTTRMSCTTDGSIWGAGAIRQICRSREPPRPSRVLAARVLTQERQRGSARTAIVAPSMSLPSRSRRLRRALRSSTSETLIDSFAALGSCGLPRDGSCPTRHCCTNVPLPVGAADIHQMASRPKHATGQPRHDLLQRS